MREFNTTGKCIPEKHYMVDISDRVRIFRTMVEDRKYFTVNRGRQYGKTTLLSQAKKDLEKDFTVFSISFEGIGEEISSITLFYQYFFSLLCDEIDFGLTKGVPKEISQWLHELSEKEWKEIGIIGIPRLISRLCAGTEKLVVLLIDEVDQAGNYPSFLKFLGILRKMYLKKDDIPTFQSVILAGVYDIKNLKLKLRDESEHQYNSPWNIAIPFGGSMSF